MEPSVLVGIAAIIVTILFASIRSARQYGRLEEKVDALASQLAAESEARLRLLAALTQRVEKLGEQFNGHAIQDAANFGEIKGIISARAS